MATPSTHLSVLQAMLQDGEGKEQAWIAFRDRYQQLIITWCLRQGVPQRNAADMSQEIMLILIEKLATFDQERRFRPWLAKVIRNAVVSLYHRKVSAENEPVGGDRHQLFEQMPSQEATDELAASVYGYVDPVLEESLAAVKARVEDKTWFVFLETVAQGRLVADVANELGITPGAAHMAKRRATTMLKEEYENRTTPTSPAKHL